MTDSDIPLRLAAQAALREIEDMHPGSSLSANDVRRMFGAFSDQLKWVDIYPEKAEQNKMSSVTCDPCIKCGIEIRLGDGWDMASPKEREEGTFVRGCKKCFDEMKLPEVNYFVGDQEYPNYKEAFDAAAITGQGVLITPVLKCSNCGASSDHWYNQGELDKQFCKKCFEEYMKDRSPGDPDFDVGEVDKPLVEDPEGKVWGRFEQDDDQRWVARSEHRVACVDGWQPMTRAQAFRSGAIVRWSFNSEGCMGHIEAEISRIIDGYAAILMVPGHEDAIGLEALTLVKPVWE